MALESETFQLRRYQELKAGDSIKFSQVATRDGHQPDTVQMSKTEDGKTGQINIKYCPYDRGYHLLESTLLLSDGQITRIIRRHSENYEETHYEMGDWLLNSSYYWVVTKQFDLELDRKHGLETVTRTVKRFDNVDYQRTNIEEFTWNHGELSGPCHYSYYEGGQVFRYYFNGKQEGIWTGLDPEGKVKWVQHYINGQLVNQDVYLNRQKKELANSGYLLPGVIVDLISGYL